jgi:RES domain-containing protein
MPTAWRIVKKRHAESAFDGEGARRYGGRWNSTGTAVVYVAESKALALLEVLAGIRSMQHGSAYVLIPVHFDEALVRAIDLSRLPDEWNQSPPLSLVQRMGDEWVEQQDSVILEVPSVVVSGEYNYVLDPSHPDFGRIEIGAPQEFSIDPRLTR